MTDLWTPLSPPNPAAPAPRKCKRHEWQPWHPVGREEAIAFRCARCGKLQDAAVSRRNRNNRARGNRAELDVARLVGGRKVGPLGHPWDVELPGYMRLQVKKLARWPSLALVAVWLDSIGIGPDMRGVAVIQPGRGGRRLLVLDLDEFARWHGDPTEEPHDA